MKKIVFILLCVFSLTLFAQSNRIQPGAEQINQYLPLIKNKRVGVFVNQTSVVGQTPLVDVLLNKGIKVVKIFVPEHGFRGEEDAGDPIGDSKDPKTGLPIISLYGKKTKPTAVDLKSIDILVFDLQDVGVRFYTYISSLQKLMEAAVENNKPLIILDRPNPNGFYIDGPVLDPRFKSFTGMQPIPFVYAMTEGEYAKMLVGEEWLNVKPKNKAKSLRLTVIPCKNYSHKSRYNPTIKPSPSLPSIQSIYWYASLGLLEATVLSVGRGTSKPFQYYGHPLYSLPFYFIPTARPGAKHPPYKNQICRGWNLSGTPEEVLKKINKQIDLKFILNAYHLFPDKKNFFEKSFNYAVGNDILIRQIRNRVSEEKIRKSWGQKLKIFKQIRKKYLIYPDFE